MNAKENICGVIGTAAAATGTALQPNDVLQTISLVITILGGLATLVSLVVIPLCRWFKKATSDGKITKEELDEAAEIGKQAVNIVKDVKNEIEQKGGKSNG